MGCKRIATGLNGSHRAKREEGRGRENVRFSIATLGCKSNQFESQAMAKLLQERGHEQGDVGDSVDAYIINTCSVTAVSDKKSRQLIRKIQKENPQVLVAVCGCYAQVSPEEISDLGVHLVGGTGSHQMFLEELEGLWIGLKQEENQTQSRIETAEILKEKLTELEPMCMPQDNPRERVGIEALPSGGLEGRTRGLLKIQDGCDNYCTYCIIPYTRGKIRSLPLEDGTVSLQGLMAQGFSEIVLTGIEISSWGKELGHRLEEFIQRADEIAQEYKKAEGKQVYFRLGSLEPRTITEEFCQAVKDCVSLRPHFHLSLQSGSDGVLKRMNRRYDTRRFHQSVTLLRGYFGEDVAITTDLIVGFPQETEEEFQETLAFIERCELASVHVFPYSKREGTVAADKMGGHLSNQVKEERSKRATALTKEQQHHYQSRFVGLRVEVLFESWKNNQWTGHSPVYIPVAVEGARELALQNCCETVEIVAQTSQGLQGVLVERNPEHGT